MCAGSPFYDGFRGAAKKYLGNEQEPERAEDRVKVFYTAAVALGATMTFPGIQDARMHADLLHGEGAGTRGGLQVPLSGRTEIAYNLL